MKAKLDKLKKKFGVGQGEESHQKEKVVSEDYGFSQTTFEFFNKDNKRVGVLNTSERTKKEQFVDIIIIYKQKKKVKYFLDFFQINFSFLIMFQP